jgi:hypothetical protein
MLSKYENYLDLVQTEAVKDGITDFRLAREEFHNLTGKFEDGEPWFELRMTMFLDWYLLDRKGMGQVTPTEQFLARRGKTLDPQTQRQMAFLTVTMRSIFQIIDTKDETLRLRDLIRGGHWLVRSEMPTVGLNASDIMAARIVFFDGHPTVGRGIVLHPRQANEVILQIIARANLEGFDPRRLVDHLDKMRLKLDRYSNVRIGHVYRYPGDAAF